MRNRIWSALIALSAIYLPQPAAARLYAVVLEVKVGPQGDITTISVARVIDVASGDGAGAKGVAVSGAWLTAARDYVRTSKRSWVSGFTYYFMDTDAPDVFKATP